MTTNADQNKIRLKRRWMRIAFASALLTLFVSCAILTKFFPDIVFGIVGVVIFAGTIFLVAKFGKKRNPRDLETGRASNLDEFGFEYTAELTEIPPCYNTANAEPPCYDSSHRQNPNNSDNLPPPPTVDFNQSENTPSTNGRLRLHENQ
ncbi:hypothetical protein CONCODRAFT_8163 [Conidiobolus coronatus NRRL 28638]|uniref:Uncharacterized protein n=1 Tax=Conidiobolus coronatus (strain ATCC 28846 / CBS 209.66 / NRRL 28638) TaxID=796925 RepID=A0A137P3D4_CONC2|nr:hypothetical protein CONCODRAFT_8163 [Conidiobolus coronatus NRRL 28638]|eukprot:KXN69429.1 hypothetical protein CONCODRAFT_8163 [Conidiobolus coronatus NRRL 28638]